MFTMGFAKLRFSLAATSGNWPPSVLVRGDAKTGCKNLFKEWFSDAFGVGRSDGVSGLRSVGDVIRPACDFGRIRSADFLGIRKADGTRRCHEITERRWKWRFSAVPAGTKMKNSQRKFIAALSILLNRSRHF